MKKEMKLTQEIFIASLSIQPIDLYQKFILRFGNFDVLTLLESLRSTIHTGCIDT